MKKFATLLIFGALVISLAFIGIYRAYAMRQPKNFRHAVSTSGMQLTDNTTPDKTPEPSPAAVEPVTVSEPVAEPIIYRDKVVALIYHHFDPQESDITISQELFASHLDMFRAKGYNVISLHQLKNFLEGSPLPPNAVLITIDDGYTSVYKLAFPELKRRNMPAVVFVIGAYMGKTLESLPHFGWEEAREMEAHNISIQSHTYDMHHWGVGREGKKQVVSEGPLAQETDQDFARRVLQDLTTAKKELDAHLHNPAYALAWPHGRASEKARQIASEVGFKLVFTTRYGPITRQSNPLSLPRVHAGSPKVSPADLDTIIRNAAGVPLPPPSPAKPEKGNVTEASKQEAGCKASSPARPEKQTTAASAPTR